jgi:hypothetical protein
VLRPFQTAPYLIETRRQIRGRYCALSYVWGGNQHQKLTTSNVDAYIHDGIKVSLPQTIADAIFVTNKLWIQYLWVDALGIIQDSNEDKEKELGIMAQIYSNAYVTISVLSAYRADQGFLPEEHAVRLPFHLADRSMPLGQMLLEFNIPAPELRNHGNNSLIDPLAVPPLDQRGWCLQESLLSPRRLIFHPPHVWYKCPSFNNLDISRGSRHNPYPASDDILFPPDRNHGGTRPPEIGGDDFLQRWQEILRDYSRRKITVPSDKFVALASIVEVFQSISNDQYIAGLWRRTLLHDLLWAVAPPADLDEPVLLPRPEGYRAPTWSWASVDGQLYNAAAYPGVLTASYEAEILTYEATPKIRSLPFGEVTDARLTMRVKMHPLMPGGRKCSFIERKTTISADGVVTKGYWTPPPGHCLGPSHFSVNRMDGGVWPGGDLVEEVKFDCLEGTEQDHPMAFHVVILCEGKYRGSKGQWMQGLLVLPVDGKVDHYRRVAKLNLQYLSKRLDWFDVMPLKMVTLV